MSAAADLRERLKDGVHKQLEENTRTIGDRTALHFNDEVVTYAQLHARANRVAHVIQTHAKGPMVATVMQNQVAATVALIAISKAVGSWIPVQNKLPDETKRAYLSQFDNPLVLTDYDTPLLQDSSLQVVNVADALTDSPAGDDLPLVSGNMPDDHILFFASSSGTTGTPKAVAKPYRLTYPGLSRPNFDNPMFIGDVSSSAFTFSLLTALCQGRTAHTMDLQRYTIQDIHQRIRAAEVGQFFSVPSVFRVVFADAKPGDFPSLKKIMLGAEPFLRSDFELFKRNFPRGTQIINAMGISEAGLVASFEGNHDTVVTTDTVPVGTPQWGLDVYVVNEQGERIVGEKGEIHVSGERILQYWNNPEENAKKFFPDAERPGWMVVHTGDVGMMLEDGNLVHLGRLDNRVTIRGHQVDMIPIETAMSSHPAVQQVVVQPYTSRSEPRLAAYFVASENAAIPNENAWWAFLARALPDYMIPTHFIQMDALPTLANGKVNRRALPDPFTLRAQRETPVIRPETEVEKELFEIWDTLLDMHFDISTDDSFFRLGGSSLQATVLISAVNETFDVVLTPAMLYQNQSIKELARLIESGEMKEAMHPALIPFRPTGRRHPIICFCGVMSSGLQYQRLSNHMGDDYPMYGVEIKGMRGDVPLPESMDEMIDYYVEAIESLQFRAPVYLMGSSIGGVHAFEAARRLQERGAAIEAVIMLDTMFPTGEKGQLENWEQFAREDEERILAAQQDYRDRDREKKRQRHKKARQRKRAARKIRQRIRQLPQRILSLLLPGRRQDAFEMPQSKRSQNRWRDNRPKRNERNEANFALAKAVRQASSNAISAYQPVPYDGNLIYFRALRNETEEDYAGLWEQVTRGKVTRVDMDSDHNLTNHPAVIGLADELKKILL